MTEENKSEPDVKKGELSKFEYVVTSIVGCIYSAIVVRALFHHWAALKPVAMLVAASFILIWFLYVTWENIWKNTSWRTKLNDFFTSSYLSLAVVGGAWSIYFNALDFYIYVTNTIDVSVVTSLGKLCISQPVCSYAR